MQVKKIILFFLLLIINDNLEGAVELDSKMDNSLFLSRAIYRGVDYSFCLINGSDIKNPESNIDFSFENSFSRVGRLKRLGIWRELINPLGFSASSDMFYEAAGLEKNFSFHSRGLYGISLELDKGTGINVLFPDNLWLGVNYTFNTDPLFLTPFASVSGSAIPSNDAWTSTYPFIPKIIPFHYGLHSVFHWNHFRIDYLGSFSGSHTYKAGSYNRLILELIYSVLSVKALGGITSPYFISTDGKLSEREFLLSLWLEFHPFKYLKTVIRTEYSEDHSPVLPEAYVPSGGGSSIKIKYDNSQFICSTELGQKFNFDSYGIESVENKLNGKIGVSGWFSLFINYGISFDFESLTERKLELNAECSIRKTDVEIVIKHSEEIFEPVNQNTFRLRVDQEVRTGSLYFKIELEEGLLLENLSIGFKTVIGE